MYKHAHLLVYVPARLFARLQSTLVLDSLSHRKHRTRMAQVARGEKEKRFSDDINFMDNRHKLRNGKFVLTASPLHVGHRGRTVLLNSGCGLQQQAKVLLLHTTAFSFRIREATTLLRPS